MIAAAIALALTAGSDSLLARAESLLAAGALPQARRIAERLERERPDDPRPAPPRPDPPRLASHRPLQGRVPLPARGAA
jgi:hypothetical protein